MAKYPKSLSTLAIGSVPFETTLEAVDLLASYIDIPAVPQMVRLSPWEDMILGSVHGLPAINVDETTRSISVTLKNRENALADFYEKFLAGDYNFLALPPESSRGFTALLDRARKDPDFGHGFLKSQLVGPLTFGQSVKVEGGYSLLDDPSLLEMAGQALGAKAAWEADQIRATGRTPVIFLDEPGLTGYGSAFSTLTPEMVISVLGTAVRIVHDRGPALVGCHVCGNTDWGLMTKVGLDIINFDAYEFLENFSLYPRELSAFYEQGGLVAWGIVPTQGFTEQIKASDLAERLRRGWENLGRQGIDYELIKSRALITSACGLGSLTSQQARGIMAIMPQVATLLA